MKAIGYIAAMSLAGLTACAGAPPKSEVNLKVMGDTYCKIGEKWRWDVKDTRATIAQARRVNAKYDRVCNSKKKSTKTS